MSDESHGRSPERESAPKVAVHPRSGRNESLEAAVIAGGGELCDLASAEALVWADATKPHELPDALASAPGVRWVGLPYAGIEPYVPYLDDERVWTCARGVYSTPVAEHVLALALSGLRNVVGYARSDSWSGPVGRNLVGANVTIFGAGGITDEVVRLLQPFDCTITVVRRRADPYPGAARTVSFDDRLDALADADVVVLALALTDETRGVIGAAELDAMPDHSWLINVARGGHVQVDPLIAAIEGGTIGGAALDVTDPEPLPAGHRLWSTPNVVITPHIANTPEMGVPLLAAHIEDNVARLRRGDDLIGVVDTVAGY